MNVAHNINKTLMNIFVEKLRSTDFGANKWSIPSILRIIRIYLKNVQATLTHILMPIIGYNIRKNLKNWFKEKLTIVNFGPEMSYYPIFGMI